MTIDDAVSIGLRMFDNLLAHVDEGDRDEVRRRVAEMLATEVVALRAGAQKHLDERKKDE